MKWRTILESLTGEREGARGNFLRTFKFLDKEDEFTVAGDRIQRRLPIGSLRVIFDLPDLPVF